jgi:uncharacterized membrane protein
MDPPAYLLELRPNCALSVRAALIFFGSVSAACLGVAAFWVSQGFWPVLPFAGLELLVLAWALYVSLRARHQWQRVSVSEGQVVIEYADRQRYERVVFPRHWSKVTLRAPHSPLHPNRLAIEAQGRSCEIAGFLTDDERRALAARLQQLIGNLNSSPPLALPATANAPAR